MFFAERDAQNRADFGGSFRCRDEDGYIRLLVSDNGGRSWKVADKLDGPFVGFTRFVTFEDIADLTRKILVRYEFNGPGARGMFTFRVDVDYLDPGSGEHPVEVTYTWSEEGIAKSHRQVVTEYPTEYTFDVAGVPVMESVSVKGL